MKKTINFWILGILTLVQIAYAGEQPINGSIPVVGGNQTEYANILNSFFRVQHTEEGALRNLTVYGIGNSPVMNLTGNELIFYGNANLTMLNASDIRQGNNPVQTVNAVFNKQNYSDEYANSGFKNLNFSTRLDTFMNAFFRIANLTSYLNTNDINIGGGYSGGGITLFGTGANKGSGYFAKDILIDGAIVAVSDVEFNRSFIPDRDDILVIGNATNRIAYANISQELYTNRLLATGSIISLGTPLSYEGSAFNKANYTSLNTTFWNRGNGVLFPSNAGDIIGIGTTSPNTKLTVIGGINASGGLNVTAGNVILTDTSGRVGIGTAPTHKLTVRGSSDPLLLLNATASISPAIWLNSNGEFTTFIYQAFNTGALTFGSPSSNPSMVVTQEGNVGINSSSPNKALKVVGGLNASTVKGCEISTNSTCIIMRCGGQIVLCPS